MAARAATILSDYSNDTLINQGTIAADAQGQTITVEMSSFTNQGTLEASNGGSLSFYTPVSNFGTISVDVGSAVYVNDGLQQTSAGTIAINVAGTTPGLYGLLSVTGGATFAGTLDVSVVDGYVPQVNDSVPIIKFDTSTGHFDTFNVSNLLFGNRRESGVHDAADVTVLFGNALKADSVVTAGAGVQPILSPQQLAPVVTEAIDLWAAAGVNQTGLAQLRQLQFQIVDLPDAELGMQDGNTVWIDQDAAGHGWFLDAIPASDQEFSPAERLQRRVASFGWKHRFRRDGPLDRGRA